MAHIKDDPICDARLKEFNATVRNIPLVDEYDGPGKCIVTGETVAAARRHRQVLLRNSLWGSLQAARRLPTGASDLSKSQAEVPGDLKPPVAAILRVCQEEARCRA